MESILKFGVRQRSAVYVLIMIGAFIVVMAIVDFILTQILGSVQLLGRQIAFSFGGVNGTYISVDQFLTALISFMLVLALFGLVQYVFVYQQRNGSTTYG